MLIAAKPGVGRVQLAVRRGFVAPDGRPLTIAISSPVHFLNLSLTGLTVYFAFLNTSFENY
jgi:hypothetical protein